MIAGPEIATLINEVKTTFFKSQHRTPPIRVMWNTMLKSKKSQRPTLVIVLLAKQIYLCPCLEQVVWLLSVRIASLAEWYVWPRIMYDWTLLHNKVIYYVNWTCWCIIMKPEREDYSDYFHFVVVLLLVWNIHQPYYDAGFPPGIRGGGRLNFLARII